MDSTSKDAAPRDTLAGDTASHGVLEGTRIRTLDGLLPVEYLQPGDRIVTRSGARRLVALSVQKRRSIDLVRIRASVLDRDHPEDDLLVAPGQGIVIRDWRAHVLYKQPAAVIPAGRLEDGEFVLREVHHGVRLFSLRFAEDEVIWAEGLELGCPGVEAEVTA